MIISPYINPKTNKLDELKVLVTCEHCNKNKKVVSKKFLVRIKEKTKEDFKYRCWPCSQKQRILPHAPIGHVYHTKKRYDRIKTKDSTKDSRQLLHRYVMEQHLNRKLTPQENVHHIDFDKYNNDISNLYLCRSISEHMKLPKSLENASIHFLNKFIWFDKKIKKYVLNKTENIMYEEPEIIFSECDKIAIRGKEDDTYPSYQKYKQRISYWRVVVECFLKRPLISKENIHHIDKDKYNNSINNLCIVTNQEHRNAHNSLILCAKELYKRGLIVFKDGEYICKETINKIRNKRPCKKYEFDYKLPEEKDSICVDCGYAILYHGYQVPHKKRKKYKKQALKSLEDRKSHICYCEKCNYRCKRSNPNMSRPCPKCKNKTFTKIKPIKTKKHNDQKSIGSPSTV
jgi:hypothetical protein